MLSVVYYDGDVGSVFVWWWYWICLGLSVVLYLGCQLEDVGFDVCAGSACVSAVGSVFVWSWSWSCLWSSVDMYSLLLVLLEDWRRSWLCPSAWWARQLRDLGLCVGLCLGCQLGGVGSDV